MDISYTNVIEQLFMKLNGLTHAFVFEEYTHLASALAGPATTTALIGFGLYGYSLWMGWAKGSYKALSQYFVLTVIVLGVLFTWGHVSALFYELFTNASGQIADVLINATPFHVPYLNLGLGGALQMTLIEFLKMGSAAFNTGSLLSGNIQPILGGLCIWLFGLGMIVLAVIELAMAKIMVALLLAVAPLFLMFLLFKPTQSYFDKWLGALVGFCLVPIFVSLMLAFALAMTQYLLGGYFAARAFGIDGLNVYFIAVLVGVLGILIIKQAANLAQGIGGTISTSGSSDFMLGALTGGAGMAMAMTIGNAKKLMCSVMNYAEHGARMEGHHAKADYYQRMVEQLQQGGTASSASSDAASPQSNATRPGTPSTPTDGASSATGAEQSSQQGTASSATTTDPEQTQQQLQQGAAPSVDDSQQDDDASATSQPQESED